MVLKRHPFSGEGPTFNVGLEATPPDSELHTRKGSGHTPHWEPYKRVHSSTPPLRHPFLNTYGLLEETMSKHPTPQIKKMRGHFQGSQLPSNPQVPLHPLLLVRLTRLERVLNSEQGRTREGGRCDRVSPAGTGQDRRGREQGQGQEVQGSMRQLGSAQTPRGNHLPGVRVP